MQKLLECNVATTSKEKTQLETKVRNDAGHEEHIKDSIA